MLIGRKGESLKGQQGHGGRHSGSFYKYLLEAGGNVLLISQIIKTSSLFGLESLTELQTCSQLISRISLMDFSMGGFVVPLPATDIKLTLRSDLIRFNRLEVTCGK